MLNIDPSGELMTIDQVAQQTGMTVRNIRAHQARGLLPAPEVRGRTGYYNQEHLARVRLVQDLQAEGLNLEAIGKLLARTPAGSAAEALALRRTALRPWEEEQPLYVDRDELAARLGRAEPALIDRAEALGLVRRIRDDRYEVASPTLLRVAEELVGYGFTLEAILRSHEKVTQATDAIAAAIVELFDSEIWAPFDERGRPADEWARVAEVMERTRPLASESTIANLRRSLSRAAAESVARDLQV